MALDRVYEWALVVSARIAHADGILEGSEVERLLSMVEEHIELTELSEWLTLVSDADAIDRAWKALQPPPPNRVDEALEQAWLMALADGEHGDEELALLKEAAARVGVDGQGLETRMVDWAERGQQFAEAVTMGAAWVFGGGRPLSGHARTDFRELVQHVPADREHREELELMAAVPPRSELGPAAEIEKLGSTRKRALTVLARAVQGMLRPDESETRLKSLARAAGMSADDAEALLEDRGIRL